MFSDIKERVCNANIELADRGVVIYTWGNVSEADKNREVMIIKPSGINYSEMRPEDMVVVDIKTGKTIEGNLKPSSDSETHLELYRAFPEIGGISHTHSINAVAFAQAGMDIPALGTTHADYFYGPIPCTRQLSRIEVDNDYEKNTGKVIVECIKERNYYPMTIPGIVVKDHGPFTWGKDAQESVYHAVVLETIAEIAIKTLWLNPEARLSQTILDKHFSRKHGPDAYYGQK